jgi:hypothetical protein
MTHPTFVSMALILTTTTSVSLVACVTQIYMPHLPTNLPRAPFVVFFSATLANTRDIGAFI